jgi:DNA-binding SARP family transcriptional activator/TolB-like protein
VVSGSDRAPVHVRTLGPLVVRRGGVETTLPQQRLRCAILLVIAVERRITRDALLAMFWPDREPERGRHALSQNLYELRRAFGSDWIDATPDAVAASPLLRVDALDFEAAVGEGRIDDALALYDGHFLDDFVLAECVGFDHFVDRVRSRLARAWRRALRDGLAAREAAGDFDTAIVMARRAVEIDPSEDETQHRLISLLAAAGERAEALRQYARYEAALKADELTPLEDTRALVARLRAEDPTADREAPLTSLPPPPAAPATAATAATLPRPRTEAAPAQVGAARHGRRVPVLPALAVAAVLAVAVGVMFFRDGGGGGAAAPANGLPRLAVLQFEDLTEEPRSANYLAGQLAAALTEALHMQLPEVGVVAAYALPAELRARDGPRTGFAVDGTITGGAARISVRVRLLDLATGQVLRARELSGHGAEPLALIHAVVDEASEFVRQALGRELRQREWRAGTSSEQAFDLFARGVELHRRWGSASAAGEVVGAQRLLATADSFLEQAERHDPSWPDPAVLRAGVAADRGLLALQLADERAALAHLEIALAHAERAVRARPGYPAALEARGRVRYLVWSYLPPAEQRERRDLIAAAEDDLRSTVESAPWRASAWSTLSALHMLRADFELARFAADQGYRADAYFTGADALLQRLFTTAFELGLDDEAADRCAEGQRRYPGAEPFLECALILSGWGARPMLNPDSAWQLAARLYRSAPRALADEYAGVYESLVAGTLVRAGMADSARAVVERVAARLELHPHAAHAAAAVFVLLDEPAAATELLGRVLREQPNTGFSLVRSRRFEPLRGLPAYDRLTGPGSG